MSICDLYAVVRRRSAQWPGELPGSLYICVEMVLWPHLIGHEALGKKECFAPSVLAH